MAKVMVDTPAGECPPFDIPMNPIISRPYPKPVFLPMKNAPENGSADIGLG